MTEITVQCLGAFRDLGDHFVVSVEETDVASIRSAVSSYLGECGRTDLNGVLSRSVFAEGDEILKDHFTVASTSVSLLPPVAGG